MIFSITSRKYQQNTLHKAHPRAQFSRDITADFVRLRDSSGLRVHFIAGVCGNKQLASHLLDLLTLCVGFPSCTPALLGSEADPSCRSIRVLSRDSKRAIHQVHNATTSGDLRVLSCKRHPDTCSNQIKSSALGIITRQDVPCRNRSIDACANCDSTCVHSSMEISTTSN